MLRLAQLLFAIATFLAAEWAEATDIRGRIDTRNPYTGYYQPYYGAEVMIMALNGYQVAVSYTGPDGFYYFYGISPGAYQIVVNRTIRVPVNIPAMTGYDLGPILFQ
ncbi:MAG: hypothetical protein DHS20C11_11480 [Lysobacteraceae bacterium]|nr:MAG: hypothetical protein DHS20C11_11480 [Xanthomonadaceae bacterium]